jgi:hypothetical protein
MRLISHDSIERVAGETNCETGPKRCLPFRLELAKIPEFSGFIKASVDDLFQVEVM